MNRVVPVLLAGALAALLFSGCGGSSNATTSTASKASVQLDPLLVLAEEPAGALSVAELRESAKEGDEVVVAGWIAGSRQPIVEGRAAFTIVDLNVPPMECTATPHTLCCVPKEVLLPRIVLVKFVDEQGKTILKDAHGLLGVKEGATVVVRGRVQCTEEGEVTALLADGVYMRGDSYMAPEGVAVQQDTPETLPVFDTGLPMPE